jgi:PAS domain S-box-containing protein
MKARTNEQQNGKARATVTVISSPEQFAESKRRLAERKRTEEALRDSEERLRLAVEVGRMYAFEWDLKTDRVQRSDEYFQILGLAKGESSNAGSDHVARVCADDRDHFTTTIRALRPGHSSYKLSYRMMRPDRNIVWLEESGRAFFDSTGNVKRIVGISADVTEAKAFERALRELSGRLITSQEEERRRVARELHDNIGQELALLAVRAQRIDSGASAAQGTTHRDVHELHKRIKEVATKVSNLSHRLHSSELEFLGLTIAADRFCRDFSRCYGIDVEYVVKDVPEDLDKGVALCFYRIIQESLQNVAKHSNAKRVLFRLTGGLDKLRLEVRDKGIGFDVEHIPNDSGLGLVSMRERMNLVGGTFSIRSKSGQGTTVEASVALTAGALPVAI